MTHTDLIARLRQLNLAVADDAADALTAAQDRIESLEAALKEAADELDEYYRAEYPLDHQIHRRNLKYLMENNPARADLDATGKGKGDG